METGRRGIAHNKIEANAAKDIYAFLCEELEVKIIAIFQLQDVSGSAKLEHTTLVL
jgi:hypothetical protein